MVVPALTHYLGKRQRAVVSEAAVFESTFFGLFSGLRDEEMDELKFIVSFWQGMKGLGFFMSLRLLVL